MHGWSLFSAWGHPLWLENNWFQRKQWGICLPVKKNEKYSTMTIWEMGRLFCLAQRRLPVDCGRWGSNPEFFQTNVGLVPAHCPHLNAFHSQRQLIIRFRDSHYMKQGCSSEIIISPFLSRHILESNLKQLWTPHPVSSVIQTVIWLQPLQSYSLWPVIIVTWMALFFIVSDNHPSRSFPNPHVFKIAFLSSPWIFPPTQTYFIWPFC